MRTYALTSPAKRQRRVLTITPTAKNATWSSRSFLVSRTNRPIETPAVADVLRLTPLALSQFHQAWTMLPAERNAHPSISNALLGTNHFTTNVDVVVPFHVIATPLLDRVCVQMRGFNTKASVRRVVLALTSAFQNALGHVTAQLDTSLSAVRMELPTTMAAKLMRRCRSRLPG